jgi:fermentation-respiration switch protein FrsA (DUF1100 family)
MARRIGWIVAALLAAGGLTLVLRSLEAGFLYFPTRDYDVLPRDLGLRADELSLQSKGGVKLAGWWIHGEGRRALLYFHGNGGNASHRLERARILVENLGLDVVLVDYRGYGRSTGRPDEDGLYADGEAVWEAAAARGVAPERIVVFGESLGCAVAIETAVRRRCAGVILETPFASIAAMARRYYPFIPTFLIATKYDNEAKIARLAVPKLIVAAEKDDVVPPDHARRLFETARAPKEFYSIRGATHNDTYVVGGREYLDVWRKFLESLPAGPEP